MILTKSAKTVLEKRYLKKTDGIPVEAPEDMLRRVAHNVASVEALYDRGAPGVEDAFFDAMDDLDFLPNSPTLMNAGRELQQLSACFVLPIEDSMLSIFDSVKNAALIHQSGGGTGFSFSRLRPKNDVVRSTGGIASGPVSFLKVFNSATEAVKQGGTRRGANMGILRVDHPDIMEFITCKHDNTEVTNFNLSVAITDAFMRALDQNADYDLVNPRTGLPTGKINARVVFRKIVEMAWRNGEPGVVFLDRINADNPTPGIGSIESTNPCGEQPLLPYEACCLGSVNLAHMVRGVGPNAAVDYDKLRKTVWLGVRFLDNIIDANRYPLAEIEQMSKANRKIGLGVMGWHDMLVLLGIAYDSEDALALAERLMSFISQEAVRASEQLAAERGSFPNFEKSIFKGTRPRRNATLTTVAPTGTLSIIAGCSSGVEPVFALAYVRHVLDNQELVEVHPLFEQVAKAEGFWTDEIIAWIARAGTATGAKGVPEKYQRLFRTALEIDPIWHVRMQAAFQTFTDNAVSKTINLPNDATIEDIEKVYLLAYKIGCKGLTVYRDKSREAQVLTTGSSQGRGAEQGAQALGEGSGVQAGRAGRGPEQAFALPSSIEPRPRPEQTSGTTERVLTGCGKLYVTVNKDDIGLCEVFASMGKSGGCAASQSEAIARLVSLALRSGVRVDSIVRELRGIRCPSPSWQNGGMVLSCADAMGIVLERQMKAFTSAHSRENGHGHGEGMNGDPPWAPHSGYGEGSDLLDGDNGHHHFPDDMVGREAEVSRGELSGGHEKTRAAGGNGAERGTGNDDAGAKGTGGDRDVHGSSEGQGDEGTGVRLSSSLDRLDLLTGACPECGGHMTHQSGCATCMFCGYSKCM
jgi:ribonucleoside-diphosphate reductase alpha chain